MINLSRSNYIKGIGAFVIGVFIPWLLPYRSIFIDFCILAIAYAFYEIFRNRIPNKWKYFFLSRSLIVILLTIFFGFISKDMNLKQALFTFSGVYLGFWLDEQIKQQEERRKIKFFLGMIWQELRYNRVLLNTIKENYKFFMDDEKNLDIMFYKFSSINTHSRLLKSSIYDSFVSSNVITGLKNDKIFNDITTAYTNIRFLQSAFSIVVSDFEIKLRINHYAIDQYGKNEYIGHVLNDLGNKIKDVAGKELIISYRSICKAIESVDAYLNSLGVKNEEEKPADSDLIDEDKTFLEEVLAKSPQKVPKDIF